MSKAIDAGEVRARLFHAFEHHGILKLSNRLYKTKWCFVFRSFLFSCPLLTVGQRWSNLTCIFFKWVGGKHHVVPKWHPKFLSQECFPDSRYALVVTSAYEMTLPKFSVIEIVIQCWDSYYHHLLEAYDNTSHKSQGTKGFTNPSVDQSFCLCCTVTCCIIFPHILTHQTIYDLCFVSFWVTTSPMYTCANAHMYVYTGIYDIYIYYNIIFVNQLCFYIWHTVSQFAFLGSIFHFGCAVFSPK